MESIDDVLSEIEHLIHFYNRFREELWLLMRKYKETDCLKAELHRVDGAIEVLQELKRRIKDM